MNNNITKELQMRVLELEKQLTNEFGCTVELNIKNFNGVSANKIYSKNKILAAVVEAACEIANCKPVNIKTKTRKPNIVDIRHICFTIVRELNSSISYAQIGLKFGGLNHTTVLHGIIKCQERIKIYKEYKQLYNQIKLTAWKKII